MTIRWNKIGIHVLVVIGFIIVSLAYFYPVLQGKTIYQSDIVQHLGMSKHQKDFIQKYNEEPYWIDNAFGGMPSYQVGANYPHHYIKSFDRFLRFLPRPADYLFIYFIGLYILLMVMGVKPLVAFFGALVFGFSTYLVIILGVGHNAKAHAIAYMPLVIAGVLLCLRQKYFIGFLLLSIGVALEICANHFQMTYYLTFICIIIGLVYLVYAIKVKSLKPYFKGVGMAIVAAILGLSLNASSLLATQEYSTSSTRGESVLNIKSDGSPKTSKSALDYAYITEYSYGIVETLNLLIPRFMGGSNAETISTESETYQELLAIGASPSQAKDFVNRAPLYWGDQPFVAAPAYIGAGVLFLFVLALFLIPKRFKVWIVGASLLALMLSWGDNLSILTNFFIGVVPLYDKFRAVSSIQVILELCVPLMAFVGFTHFISPKVAEAQKIKALKNTALIFGSLLTALLLFKSTLFSFSGTSDSYFIQQFGANFVRALKEDRKAAFLEDVFRSLIIIALISGVLWYSLQQKVKIKWVVVLVGIICTLDLVIVDKRYVNADDFVSPLKMKKPFLPNAADKEILEDKTHFRVLDLSESPFNSARASYFHKSLGGYHAAKPKRISDLFEFHIAQGNTEVLDMFNVKYTILNDQEKIIAQQNPNANGNAWFVDSLQVVSSEDEAILALYKINTKKTAIILNEDKKNISQNFFNKDTMSNIVLTDYTMNKLEYQSTAKSPSFAVFSEVFYPKSWQAYIDGKPVEHYQVNYTLRGLLIPEGKHHITFKFEPEVVMLGSKLSLAGHIIFVLLICLGFWKFIKR